MHDYSKVFNMIAAKVVVVVKDPFEVSLLTSEDANLLVRGSGRLQDHAARQLKPESDPLGLPVNEWQCVHVETTYKQQDGAPKGVTIPQSFRCTHSIDNGGFLCSYHDRHLLSIKLSPVDQAQFKLWYETHAADIVVDGVIKADQRELRNYTIQKRWGLKIHTCPTPPQLVNSKTGKTREIAVDPEWEKVELVGAGQSDEV